MTLADLRPRRRTLVAWGGSGDGPGGERPRRRAFSAEHKLAILDEYDRADGPGAKGALLRREALYSSHIVEWRRVRDAGALAGLTSRPRAPSRRPQEVELERLRRRAEPAEAELAKTKAET